MTFADGIQLGMALGLVLGLTIGISLRPVVQGWNVIVLRRNRGR